MIQNKFKSIPVVKIRYKKEMNYVINVLLSVQNHTAS